MTLISITSEKGLPQKKPLEAFGFRNGSVKC